MLQKDVERERALTNKAIDRWVCHPHVAAGYTGAGGPLRLAAPDPCFGPLSGPPSYQLFETQQKNAVQREEDKRLEVEAELKYVCPGWGQPGEVERWEEKKAAIGTETLRELM